MTLLFIALGVVAMGLARGYFGQAMWGLQEAAIRSGFAGSLGSGHLVLRDKRLDNSEERIALEFGIDNADTLISEISKINGFDYALPRTQFGGLASNGEKSLPFKAYAVESEVEAKLRDGLKDIADRHENLSVGVELRQLGAMEEDGVILGVGLAKALYVDVGDTVTLLGTTVDGAVNGVDVKVAALISTGALEVDRIFLIVLKNTAAALLNANSVGEISVMLDERGKLDKSLEEVRAILKKVSPEREYSVTRWENHGHYYTAVRDLFKFMFGFLELIIIVIVLISCWNIVNMTTMERVREIGTMRAIGIKIRTITSVFLIEGALMSVAAVIIGMLIQVVISYVINHANIVMPPVPGGNQSFILKIQYVTEYHPYIALVVVAAVVISSFASFFAIKRLTITQAIDHA